MAKSSRTHVGGAETASTELTPMYLSKEEFGRRVYKLMVGKRMRQADLARRAGLTRDAISTYVTGRSFPSPANAKKLADALGVTAEELLPNLVADAISHDRPDFELKTSSGDPSKAWVKLDRSLSLATAVRIAELVEADGKTAD